MSLGDMSKRVGTAGQAAYNAASARMMQEKQAHDKQVQMHDLDRTRHEISHRKIEHQRVQGEIQRVKREILSLRRVRDTKSLDLLRSTEAHLRSLESEASLIDRDIRAKTLEVQRHGGMSF